MFKFVNRLDIPLFYASFIVIKAEVLIKLNSPPNPGGKGTKNKSSVARDDATSIPETTIRDIRSAYKGIDTVEDLIPYKKKWLQTLTPLTKCLSFHIGDAPPTVSEAQAIMK